MLHLLLATVMLAQPMQQPAPMPATPPAPVRVSRQEARQHCVSGDDELYLRVSQGTGPFFAGIKVTVVIDVNGTVVSAVALAKSQDRDLKLSPGLLSQAEVLTRGGLHFKPFERAGHPVSATFEHYVALLPPESKPSRHVTFPKVKDWKTVKIVLARSGCFGTCPSYRIEVRGDGSVLYEGHSFVTVTGSHRGLVPQSNVIELVKLFEKADYYSLSNEYRASVTDNPTQITSIEIDGRQKMVEDYVGLDVGMPLSVSYLEAAIDRYSGSMRWTHGTAETVAALEAEHWDFKSDEAAATLARAAQYGDADVVSDLAMAGVPLTGKANAQFMIVNGEGYSVAIQTAAGRGDLAMLHALLNAGAATNPKILASSLVYAAGSRNVAALRLLLENGAAVTSRDERGFTALLAAAVSGSPEMVKEVLKKHSDVNASAALPPPPCTAEMKKNDDCREFTKGDGRTALMEAVSADDYDVPPEDVNRVEVARLLLDAGADVNARDKEGNTALILACDNPEQVLLLLQAGADPNVRNHEGETALSKTSDNEIKEVLIKHGAVPAPR